MRVTKAAIEAAAEGIYERAFRQELPEAPIDLARAALEAAMPYIRKQIAEEIRYGINEYSGQLIEQAARIAEGETK